MKLADNISRNTFSIWAAKKSAEPETDQQTRARNGKTPNATPITREEFAIITHTTAKA